MELFYFFLFTEMMIVSFLMTKNWFHVIMILLLMEMMSIMLFKLSSLMVFFWMMSVLLFLIMVMMVIEASIGMSLVVSSSRSTGENSANV